jgi:hypothetical protein
MKVVIFIWTTAQCTWLYNSCKIVKLGWSELAPTNAPVEDEPVQPVLRMNQNHILPAQIYIFFPASTLPQNISLLPTYLLPTPSYLPPTSPLLPPIAIARAGAGAPEPEQERERQNPSFHFQASR